MSVQIKMFGKTEEVIEAGLADKIHDLMMAVMVLDFTDITAGIKSPVNPKTLEAFAARLESWAEKEGKHPIYIQESDVYIVAMEDDNILGVATMNWDTDIASKGFRLSNVFVVPTARRRGIASKMVDAAVKCGQDNNITFMSLNVAYHNKAAQALYAKYGFEPARLNMMRPMEPKAKENVD